jgi:hypothetical protein
MTYRIALALFSIVVVLAVTACGDDDDDGGDTRASAVGATSENAVDAWVADGAEGLHEFLAQSVTEHCSVEALANVLANQPQPTAWRNTKDFEFPAEDEATATVIIVVGGEDVEQSWSFVNEDGPWRVTDMPGLSTCAEDT